MDYQNRAGSKKGGGGIASKSLESLQLKKRLYQLAADVSDVDSNPYLRSLPGGVYECKLCLTKHKSTNSFILHTQGRRHQQSLEQRKRLEAPKSGSSPASAKVQTKSFVKIGRPGYKITKIFDPAANKRGLHLLIKYPQIKSGLQPMHRLMSAYEQQQEPVDGAFQYLVIAAEPYDTIAIKIRAPPIDKSSLWSNFDQDTGDYHLQILLDSVDEP
ncbi:Pre-mRNA-splicing factor sap62 [Wickerhamiella sorbophila]|uniref:Pre-mRNA-splicing factor sap62 n=1 Tax=Wickerhamiella sorbophila TaxID=45607 RepID=A0A2T0FFK1_9ASCO|nr:Pre-mRNA-splicing factor sap62 [Wickerhamiella sorbophila]PRT53747.1 Pre-mRNA-splicing factor sap62 [Wickerhamiella sorbophila]